ncbi:protein mono-ADP-ribosyltransferase PARP14-like isoform X1 [Acanthopagrus latus]|uniref:protein mono-ADP-ribosyltransferase PARP14-like isoform X1 n=1 Tax=Acanthopagrus latus TaxID=8177 RepID=UPI00187C5F04|nr:protein mono-ADP-ribosyltransferase PARP14-like isoform X1 [Acanthopagrus latus]
MEAAECEPVTVDGFWSSAQTKTVKNKLQLYFGSKKKSGGGDCRVEAEDGAPRAAVFFSSEEVRQRVLARANHDIIVDNQTIQLRLTPGSRPANNDGVSDSQTQKSNAEAGENKEESVQSAGVVLENVADDMSRDLLLMLVENISGLDDSCFSLEIIWESNRAAVTFSSAADVEKFLTVTQSSQKLQKHGLSARPLEAADSVRVESLPPTVVKDMLELYFEKNWALPDRIVMIPDEQAAIVTFKHPKVVENICSKRDYMMGSISVRVYPYHESLASALYGKERPAWKMPEPFTEKVHHVIWKFLQMKKLFQDINDQMHPYFCSVDLNNNEVKLSPLPGFLRQKGLNAERVNRWMSTALDAFRQQMSQYTAFECAVNAAAWKAAEKDVRSVVREDAVLVMDSSRDTLTVAGRADDMKQLRGPVEDIVRKAITLIKRQTEAVSEGMTVPPAMFYILKQEGLQKAAQHISPDMSLSYDKGTQMITITGLPAEVFQTKSWILEKKVGMSKKPIAVPPGLLDFLSTVDPMDMSQDLFTSQGITAIYGIEDKQVMLLGSSDRVLADAQSKMKQVLSLQTLDVEDQEVLKRHDWMSLNKQLLDTYNSSTKTTVTIQIHPDRGNKITVAGFLTPVNEVSSSLREFIVNYSQVQETIRVKSGAVVQFIDKKKSQDWKSIAKANDVKVYFDEVRPKILIAGARVHVQKARSCFLEMTGALSTDILTVDKPGAKKYFLSAGHMVLSTMMSELSCVVMLRPDNQPEEEEDNYEVEDGSCYCKVRTASGVLVSVSKADICRFSVDAVVNAANEELQHIGGLALALLKAAGPELQKVSNDYISRNRNLRPGEAIVTRAFNLPCKHVVHAVGPRFSDSDERTSVLRLKLAVRESLRQAEKVSCSSIALPAISSGVFGFPVDLCADTIAQSVREFCDSPGSPRSLTEIHLVDNNHSTVKVLATAVNTEFSDLGPTLTIPQAAGGRAAGASGRYQRSQGQNQVPRNRGFAERGEGARGGGAGSWGGWEGDRGDQSLSGPVRPGGHGGPRRAEQTTAEGLKIVLWRGNVQDQTTDVIVNTISDTMNLNQGAVSKAILQAAGPGLQPAVNSEAGVARLPFGKVVVTDGYNLMCRKVFHAVCPFWDYGAGQAEADLKSLVRSCLDEAEQRKMASLSFPAIGTGNLSFPRDVVSRVLLQEIHSYSRRRTPRHLREVAIVVHPSDSQTVDRFTREFSGPTGQRVEQEEPEFNEPTVVQSVRQPQQNSASFGQVLSPTLGVYRMQMGQLTLEVSSGDITKEDCDVIINSSNPDFTLRTGVSKAILDSAGPAVQLECSHIVSSPGYQPRPMILTSGGRLPSRNIIHIVGQSDPAKIKDVVYAVLKVCEENRFSSVSFPALGTGQGGASPSAVADAMVGAVVEFVRKKHARFVGSVKILIFQTVMVTEFHKSMKKREGEEVEGKSVLTWLKDKFTSILPARGEEQLSADALVLEREEFEPTVFQLCADNDEAVSQAKRRIKDLIVAEQAKRTITDSFISHLSRADMDQLSALQRKLTVSIHLEAGRGNQEPRIHLEGLTRDVFTAESEVRDIIKKVERSENLRKQAFLVSGLVEWKHQQIDGTMASFDIYTNLQLEEALETKQSVKIEINNQPYIADVMLKKAVSARGRKVVELQRKDLKAADDAALPSTWADMKGGRLKLFPLAAGSNEYNDVEKELRKTGLRVNIIQIERVQNISLWKSYQQVKTDLEVKNKHTNNERQLFHGTGPKSIDLINKQGFNRSYAGQHAAMYGNGSYFAVDPSYSAQGYAKPDARGQKRMYLARVLVGDFTQGRSGMIVPPVRNTGNAADLYDSVVDNTANPSMFIVFSDTQAYPEYLITFT